jgi:hypothetical protein
MRIVAFGGPPERGQGAGVPLGRGRREQPHPASEEGGAQSIEGIRQDPDMASRTSVVFEDDIDGTKAVETLAFGLDGVLYEIDLSEKNAAKLRAILQRHANAARRIAGRSTRGRGKAPARTERDQISAIRTWARETGRQVSDRGRLPAAIIDAYHAAV